MWFFVERPEAVLAELRRVLRPGGRLVIATAQDSLLNRVLWSPYGLRLYRDQEMAAMLRAAGFAEVAVSSPGLMDQIAVARKEGGPAHSPRGR